MGDFKGAIASLKNVAVRRDSLGQNAAYHLGLSYVQANQKPQAVTAFEAARQSTFDKNIAENATLRLGQVQYELGNLPEVIAVLQRLPQEVSALQKPARRGRSAEHQLPVFDRLRAGPDLPRKPRRPQRQAQRHLPARGLLAGRHALQRRQLRRGAAAARQVAEIPGR